MLSFLSPVVPSKSFFPRRGITVALLSGMVALSGPVLAAQSGTTPAPAATQADRAPVQADPAAAAPAQDGAPSATISNTPDRKGRIRKGDEKVVKSKDTVKDERQQKRRLKDNPLANVNSTQPDKQLYDKAQVALKKGRFDVARLELQTLLATYPDSEYQMRAKLAFADSWYREGGTAALTQAETEYHDFIIFFPNAPEAAEAQFRIGEIYFKQMDKPDRDYSKAVHAQEEYRNMLTQYPDSALVPQAKQRLREVQEALATRETEIGTFYLGRENWAGAIARYQTVVDTDPLFSHIDDALIGLGDAYSAEVRYVRRTNLPEDAKARLLKIYETEAAAAYGRVVTQYAASPRVEDARDRLEALGAAIPTPTAEQLAASQALENSRKTYTLANRAKGLIIRGPDVVLAPQIGEPSMADPKPTLAPQVAKKAENDFKYAVHPETAPAGAPPATVSNEGAAGADAAAAASAPAAGAPALQDIPAAGSTNAGGAAVSGSTFTDSAPKASGGTGLGVEILTPTNGVTPGGTANTRLANGLSAVGPANREALPPVETPEAAPDAVNDVAGVKTPQGQATPAGKKKPKPAFDKSEESSSTHKKKKGLKKLNPL